MTPLTRQCLQLQTKHPQSQRWCGHQRGLLWWSLHTMERREFPKYFIIHNNMTWGLSKLKLSFIETRMSWGEAACVVWIISRIKSLFLVPVPIIETRMSWSVEWLRFIKQLRPQKLQSSKIRNQWVAVPLSKQIPSWLKIWRMPPVSNDNNANNKTF